VQLVVAERLSGIEPDQHGAPFVLGLHDDRRPAASGCLDFAEVPGLHL